MSSTNTWIRKLRLDEFELLNADWCGSVSSVTEAVIAFEGEGVDRLAPLSFSDWMDPDYYREVHPEFAGMSDPEVYRCWLFSDSEKGWPSSPEAHLRSLGLVLSIYPDAFDWRAYASSRGIVENRWFALQHLVENGLEARDQASLGPTGQPNFAAALGHRFRGRDDPSAIIAFETARVLGDVGYATAHHLADARFRRGEWGGALRLFSEAARHLEASVWTFVNGARAAARLGGFRAAAGLLRAGRTSVGSEAAWRECVHELVESYFETRTRRARRLYAAPGGRSRADRLITKAAQRACELWDDLDPIGASLPAASDGRVVILASFDIPACVDYRVKQKVEQLRRLGRPCSVFSLSEWEAFIAALPGASAAVVFRLPAWPTATRAMTAAHRMGVPTYYDIDDLIFDAAEFPDVRESYGGLINDEQYEALLLGAPLFRLAISLCDYAIAPTTFLAGRLQPLVRERRAFVVPNGLDARHETLALPQSRPAGEPAEGVTIFYASGTPAHTADFNALAGPALVEVLRANPQVRLVIVGHVVLSEAFDSVRGQVVTHGFVDDLGVLWGMLAQADINLAVLTASPATDAKSEIKWLEAAVVGVPSIVSATATYREVLEDGVDALLADTTEDWRAALNRLVADASLRRSIGQRARAKVASRYGPSATAESLARALDAATARAATQSVGGLEESRVLLATSDDDRATDTKLEQELPPKRRAAAAFGPVQLLCVHPDREALGAKWIEAALRRGGFGNLALTLVDASRDASEVETLIWGRTPVRILGHTGSMGLQRLASEAQVLLFSSSSTAPAAFTVEAALTAGLWVVIERNDSSRGAVQLGSNGFIIGDAPGDLESVLALLDGDPELYRSAPGRSMELVSVQGSVPAPAGVEV